MHFDLKFLQFFILIHFLVALLADITGVESRPEAVTDLLQDLDFINTSLILTGEINKL